MSYLTGNFCSLVDKGKVRETNEDSALATVNAFGNVLLIVADGMGGANKGEYASNKVTNTFNREFHNLEKELVNEKQITKWINKNIVKINKMIFAKANKDKEYHGMGTTLSLCMIVKNILVTAQIGDSRIYQIKDHKLTQISDDQTYATYLLHENKISPEEAKIHKDRHKLTNALGTKSVVNVDIKVFPYEGERILLCSDGLYNNVSSLILESILNGNDSLDKKCQQLIAFGNANGGSDNMAVVIWENK